MAISSVLRRITKFAAALGSTWGTAAATEAGDGVRCHELSGMIREVNITPDTSAGQQLESNCYVGIDKTPNPSYSVRVQENDPQAMLGLASILGKDTASGGSDPYTHTMDMQVEAGKFLTLRNQEGDEVQVCPSFKPTSVEEFFDDAGILNYTVQGIGNKITTGANTECDSVTYSTPSAPLTLKNTTFRINAASGAALQVSDALGVIDPRITFTRSQEANVVCGADAIAEPKEGAYPEVKITFKIPHKNAMSKTLFAAMVAGTYLKADMITTGSAAGRSLTRSFPQLQVESCTNPDAEVIATEVTLRAQNAAAAPTGMTGITVPTYAWSCGIASALV